MAVRNEHAGELKELKAAVKDIDEMLTAQSERLDRQFLARRTWAYQAWRERYLDHPLVGTLARRLLWVVDGTAVGFADGGLRALNDQPVTQGERVELWHPVGREAAEVVAWRDWLEGHGITQPFKQAHREVYLLTDAERATGTYSNRFAAHVLRQHQFNSLAALRGWRNRLRLCVDEAAPPASRELPRWGLRAEYWNEGDGHEHGVDTTDPGAYLRLRTDQVRFYPIDAPENFAPATAASTPCGRVTVGIRSVPSRSMRYRHSSSPKSCATSTCSWGWQASATTRCGRTAGPAAGSASTGRRCFGALNQSAETRRALLERLVPRLAIADRCTLEGRFLHVKGERHTYRIHLGSGNILMSPNDRYLCIVPKSGSASGNGNRMPATGYLPYEGDRMLAVILSKAMLLAKDTEITDPTILSQL